MEASTRRRWAPGAVATAIVIALVGSLAPLAGARSVASPVAPVKVYFYGDSLFVEAAQYLGPAFNSQTTSVRVNAVGGVALCDYVYPSYHVPGRTGVPGAILQLTAANAPTVAVLQFTGNNFTPCITPDDTTPASLALNYATMLRAAVEHLLAIGTRLVIVSRGPEGSYQLATNDQFQAALLNAYQTVVAYEHSPKIIYDNAADGSVLSGPNYVDALPCLAAEVANGECANLTVNGVAGYNPVRSPDKRHFCPNTSANFKGQLPALCTVWDSGAARFLDSLVRPIWRALPVTRPVGVEPYVNSVTPSSGPATGNTAISIVGHGLAGVTKVAIAKYYAPIVNGQTLSASAPVRYLVNCPSFKVLSDHRIVAVAPPLDLATRPDPTQEYVVVFTATSQSVSGLATQAFSEP
jgi:hypothetical protein